MSSGWPLAFLEVSLVVFVVIAFGLVYLVTDRAAKRAAKKYGAEGALRPRIEADGHHRLFRGAVPLACGLRRAGAPPMPDQPEPITAAIVVIGDEILSGRTCDTNSNHIALALGAIGIDLLEVRVVSDDEAAIVEAVNALRARNAYVFTTGGIGPTHDDKTADAIAAAFGVGIDHDPRAVAMLRERFPDPADLNEGRMRMARIPFGADLIANSVSKAPGFRLENVFVMAGVPSIMRAMLDVVIPQLRTGVTVLSATLRADAKEGDIAVPLGDVQKAHPSVSIGSYPFTDGDRFNTNIVLRSRDAGVLADAQAEVEAMLLAMRSRPAKG